MHKLEKRQAIEGPEGKVVDNNVSIISSQSWCYQDTSVPYFRNVIR